jgi:transcriptional regulator with XRE-family HTH domain
VQSRCVKLKTGQRVRHWRVIRNLRQNELAKLAQLDTARLCRIETSEKSQPRADEIERLVSALGITMAEFYGEVDVTDAVAIDETKAS